MTVNAVLDEPDDEPDEADEAPQNAEEDEQQRRAERVVTVLRESLAKVEHRLPQVSQHFYATLFIIAPETRALFPANMETQRGRFFGALVHIVQMIDRPQELEPFLRQLGRDHRKFDVATEHYEAVGTALLAALKRYLDDEWTEEVERAWADAYSIIARKMQEGAAADTGPAWFSASVLEHTMLDWETAVIRVQPSEPIPYQPGQYLSVEVPQRLRLWRYLSPANAPREDGTIEFHVRAVDDGWVSRALVRHANVGDTWRIAAPMGNLWRDPSAERSLLLVAGGTGIAPMRAVLDDLAWRDYPPDTQVFFGGRSGEELYNLTELRELAARHSWLTLTPVTDDGSISDGLTGNLADVVTSYGAWPEYDVLIAGSPEMIRTTVSRLLVAGTTFDQISYDSFPTD